MHATVLVKPLAAMHSLIHFMHTPSCMGSKHVQSPVAVYIYMSMEARLAYMHYMHIDSSSTACMHQDYHACMLTFFVRQEPQPKDDKAEVPK